jgi:hypothetical protein
MLKKIGREDGFQTLPSLACNYGKLRGSAPIRSAIPTMEPESGGSGRLSITVQGVDWRPLCTRKAERGSNVIRMERSETTPRDPYNHRGTVRIGHFQLVHDHEALRGPSNQIYHQ